MKLLILALFLLTGCASKSLLSNKLDKKALGIPKRVKAQDVKFVSQTKDHCGPAALSMAFDWAGVKLTPDQASKEVFTPGAKGTYQMDIVSAARRHGLMSVKISNMEDLLRELGQGSPVVVFQNLGFDWYELWHYSVVTGYDLDKRTVYLNSGNEKNKALSFEQFERGWKRGGYWGQLILPPGKLSETAELSEHLKSAAAIENAGMETEALKAYEVIISRWPHSHWAWFALGNLKTREGELARAKTNFEQALDLKPSFSYGWYNYAFLLQEMGEGHSAKGAAANALKYANADNQRFFKKSLQLLFRPSP